MTITATKSLITFVEGQGNRFEVIFSHEESKKCLTHFFCFPATFKFKDGKEVTRWVSHTYDEKGDYKFHTLHATDLWFDIYNYTNGTIYGQIQDFKDGIASIWMNSSYCTYYWDKFGQKQFVDALDEEGEDLPDNPGTCNDCGQTFRISHEFVGGRCPACDLYFQDQKEIPDLNKMDWQWDFYLPGSRKDIQKWQEIANIAHSQLHLVDGTYYLYDVADYRMYKGIDVFSWALTEKKDLAIYNGTILFSEEDLPIRGYRIDIKEGRLFCSN